jgi:hypothetical protein
MGLYIIIITTWLGRSDIQTITINLIKNHEKCKLGLTSKGLVQELPFNIQLIDLKFEPLIYPILSKSHWMNIVNTKIYKLPEIQSRIVTDSDSLKTDTLLVSYSHPVNSNGWQIKQKGYDKSKGLLSTLSIIQIEKNPWKKINTSGYYCVGLGLFMLFVFRKPKKKRTTFLPGHNN